jgi:hypothetical protein
MTCLYCTAETSNGLALCDRCQNTLRTSFVNVAAYYGDVDNIQPGQRVKVRSAYQSTPPPEVKPGADRISETLDHTAVIIIGWARNLADDRPMAGEMPTTLVRVCGWLESYVTSIATLEWAGECLREVMDCERRLRHILDKADTGQFAGVCANEVGREDVDGESVPVLCERGLYSTKSSRWVTCPECGRCWDAKQRRAIMRAQAEDRVAPVRVLAKIVVGMTDEVSEEKLIRSIENWVARPAESPKLKSAGTRYLDGRLRTVYRVGDVLALMPEKDKTTTAEAC